MKEIFIPDSKLNENFNIDCEEFFVIRAGETKIEKFANVGDGCIFAWSEISGMTLFVFLNNVTSDELDDILDIEREFEIAFTELSDCGFLSVKFGNLHWGDGVFEPCLYKILDMPYYDDYDSERMPLTVCVVDPSKNGLVMGNRIIELGHDFSVGFAKWVNSKYFNKARKNVFNYEKHLEEVDLVRQKFTANDLQVKAILRWRFREKQTEKNGTY